MSNTNFIKINNEYVKFFASTNTALPKILQNTGALIVVQDDAKWDKNSYINDNSYMRSLWLAYNFIAEGHGFLEEDVRDFYAYYGERVKSSDGSSYMYRLAYELGNLDVHIDNVEEALSLYVLTKGGNISHTYINTYVYGSSEPTSLLAADFTKLLKPADYEDITITDFDSYIYYNYDNGHNGRKAVTKQYLSYATNIDELNFNDDSKIRCINYDIPRGAQITEVHSNYKTYIMITLLLKV